MPKIKGEQLTLLMPIADRPRAEWVDMHCPLLSGAKVGDRLYAGELTGILQVSELSGALVLRLDEGDWPAPVFNRTLCELAETKSLKAGDRVRYPAGEAEIYHVYSDNFSLGGTKFVWLPRDPNFSSYRPVPLPLVSERIEHLLDRDRQHDTRPNDQQHQD